MKLRWHSDYTFCNKKDCVLAIACWRYQALGRLAADAEKDLKVPSQISVADFDGGVLCSHFIEDEYETR